MFPWRTYSAYRQELLLYSVLAFSFYKCLFPSGFIRKPPEPSYFFILLLYWVLEFSLYFRTLPHAHCQYVLCPSDMLSLKHMRTIAFWILDSAWKANYPLCHFWCSLKCYPICISSEISRCLISYVPWSVQCFSFFCPSINVIRILL